MEQMTKQTETRNTKQESHIVQRIVAIIFGIIEVILVFRLIFKLLGANLKNDFVLGIYAITQFFVESLKAFSLGLPPVARRPRRSLSLQP